MHIHEIKNCSVGKIYYEVNDQLKEYIYRITDEAIDEADRIRSGISGIREFEKRKALVREKLLESIGGPLPFNSPLNPRITGTIEYEGLRIEKVIFESLPSRYVTGLLYVPSGISGPTGALLFLCGHFDQAKSDLEYQTACRILAGAGLVVLALDPEGQGERLGYYENSLKKTFVRGGSFEHNYDGIKCFLLGYSLARYFLHDAMRGVDYLLTRSEVDPSKVGVTGNSGGGTQSCLMMMCDERIAAAAPATFVTDRRAIMRSGKVQDAEQLWPGITAAGIDHADFLIAMAPKPVLVMAAKHDFFPIEGTRRSVRIAMRFWEMYGKGYNLELFEDDTIHAYTVKMAEKAAQFFSKHLLGTETPCSLPAFERKTLKLSDPQLLFCTKSGQVRGELENARFVYDENIERLKELELCRNKQNDGERREAALNWLREKVFSRRRQCDANPRFYKEEEAIGNLLVNFVFWWAQEGICNYALLFRDKDLKGREIPATIALWKYGTAAVEDHYEWIRDECRKGRAVMAIDLSGMGVLVPYSCIDADPLDYKGVLFKLASDLLQMGDSLPALRTYELVRAIDVVTEFHFVSKKGVKLHACGPYSLYAQLAALLDSRVEKLETKGAVESFAGLIRERYYDHYNVMSIIIPDMLKHFDAPDVIKWLRERGGALRTASN